MCHCDALLTWPSQGSSGTAGRQRDALGWKTGLWQGPQMQVLPLLPSWCKAAIILHCQAPSLSPGCPWVLGREQSLGMRGVFAGLCTTVWGGHWAVNSLGAAVMLQNTQG